MQNLHVSLCSIVTKFLPATDCKGSRIKATWSYGRTNPTKTVHYDHALNGPQNHAKAARELLLSVATQEELDSMDAYRMATACNPDGTYSHVFYP